MPSRPDATDQAAVAHARRWWTLAVLCLSVLIIFVGNSSLNVAIPTFSRVLHATNSELQWVIAAYSLVFAGLLFTTGAIGDRFGRKGALQLGLVGFLGSCLLATASNSMGQLIACRALMGVSAALIMPSTLSILVNVFPGAERSKAIAIWAATTGAASMVGPLASGWLLGHFWYGSVFLVNVPIIVLALVGGWFLLPKSRDPQEHKLDLMGALLSTVGISSLVYGLIEAPDAGWLSLTALSAFCVAFVVLAIFVRWELRVDEPMLDMSFFRNRAFSIGSSGMILIFLSLLGVTFLISQYFQLVLGFSPLGAALRFVPPALVMVVVSTITPRITSRFGVARVVAAGMTIMATGLLMFRGIELHTRYSYVLSALLLMVAGLALCMSPMTASIMSAVPARRAGAGSSMNDATRELGAALGVAVLGSLAASHFASALHDRVAKLPAALQGTARSSLSGALLAATKLPGASGRAFAASADQAFIGGVHFAVTAGAILALIAAVLVLRYLPARLPAEGALHGALESAENAVELGLGGTLPIFGTPEPAAESTS